MGSLISRLERGRPPRQFAIEFVIIEQYRLCHFPVAFRSAPAHKHQPVLHGPPGQAGGRIRGRPRLDGGLRLTQQAVMDALVPLIAFAQHPLHQLGTGHAIRDAPGIVAQHGKQLLQTSRCPGAPGHAIHFRLQHGGIHADAVPLFQCGFHAQTVFHRGAYLRIGQHLGPGGLGGGILLAPDLMVPAEILDQDLAGHARFQGIPLSRRISGFQQSRHDRLGRQQQNK